MDYSGLRTTTGIMKILTYTRARTLVILVSREVSLNQLNWVLEYSVQVVDRRALVLHADYP